MPLNKLAATKRDLCLAQFDFDAVADMMKKVGWEWVPVDGVPNRDELYSAAHSLLNDAHEAYESSRGLDWQSDGIVSSGGLRATYDGNDFFLAFVFEESDSYTFEETEEEVVKITTESKES